MSKKLNGLIIAAIFVFFIVSALIAGGNTMQIDFGERELSFSGIGDFSLATPYASIQSAELETVEDWAEWSGEKTGSFLTGPGQRPGGEDCVLFVSTRAHSAIRMQLEDGSLIVFNYNSDSGTESVHQMLLERLP